MKAKQVRLILVLLFIFGLLSACATGPTQKQIVTSMYQLYNAQYSDYLRMAADTNITEAQKVIMRKKKPILEQLGVLIPAFDLGVNAGTATPDQQQQIMDLLNKLGQM